MEIVRDEIVEDAQVVDETSSTDEVKGTPKLDYRTFDFGNLCLECGRCGHVEILELGVESGVQIIVPTTDKHELRMVCPKCKNFTRLYFTENFTKKKEATNEPETENKETESVQGVSEDN
jgi:hypothetical protein